MRISTAIAATAVSLLITAPAAPAAEGVGEIMAVIDSANVSGQLGERRLAVGSRVFIGDLVATDAAGEAQLLFADGTRMVVGSNSSLVIDKFLFNANATENATENQFSVNALGGAFRFISGDSGDRGYSIRTPKAKISVRGTAFDFTVKNGVKLVLLEGEATVCGENGEGSEDDDCATVATPCALLQKESGEDVEEIEAGDRRVRETRENFPYMTSQSSLLEEFRIVGLGCIGGIDGDGTGGLAEFALDRSAIGVPVGIGVGAALICLLVCPGGSGTPTIDTNNGSN